VPKLMFWRLPVAVLTVIAVLVLTAAQLASAAIDVDVERSRAAEAADSARCGGRS
jgi:hypothetical protein